MELNVDLFIDTLKIMGKGMLGIFIITAVIIAMIVILNKLTSPKENN